MTRITVGDGYAYRTMVKITDLRIAFGTYTEPTGLPPDDRIYRVEINKQTGRVDVMCLGMETVDVTLDDKYNSVSELPMWVQEKLSVLMMLKVDPPMEPVDGVGMRINNGTFWVFVV